jgi:hypothetical protein
MNRGSIFIPVAFALLATTVPAGAAPAPAPPVEVGRAARAAPVAPDPAPAAPAGPAAQAIPAADLEYGTYA